MRFKEIWLIMAKESLQTYFNCWSFSFKKYVVETCNIFLTHKMSRNVHWGDFHDAIFFKFWTRLVKVIIFIFYDIVLDELYFYCFSKKTKTKKNTWFHVYVNLENIKKIYFRIIENPDFVKIDTILLLYFWILLLTEVLV